MGVLSEDYAYNLALLEAREAEISRLDDAIAKVTSEMEAERTRAKAVSTKLHALEEDIQLKNLGAERDKAMNRVCDCLSRMYVTRWAHNVYRNLFWSCAKRLKC
jgi:predicted  nucleic acid-binding Zn-ribbon protein